MGGYTRLLHSGEADDLMYEIPTYVVDKLPPGMEDPEYLALNRPYAFMQWSKRAIIPEKYVFMMEPDHIWVRPMPNLMINDRPMGWPFWYIQSAMTEQLALARKYVGPLNRTEVENKVAPTGAVAGIWGVGRETREGDRDVARVGGGGYCTALHCTATRSAGAN